MKKEELKSSLDRIQPREELVNATLAKIHEQKARQILQDTQKKSFFSPGFNRGLRVAGAVCTFALVFSIGFAMAKLGGMDPVASPADNSPHMARTLDTTDVVNNTDLNIAMYTGLDEEEWIAVRGNVSALRFRDLTEEQSAMGAIACADVTISIKNIEARSEVFSRGTINSEITATVLLYDTETINTLVDASEADLLVRLMPTENEGWDIMDLYSME